MGLGTPRSKSTVGSRLVSAIISAVAGGPRLNAPRTHITLKACKAPLSGTGPLFPSFPLFHSPKQLVKSKQTEVRNPRNQIYYKLACLIGAEKAPLDYRIMTPSCKLSLNGHSHNGSHEDVVPVMLEVNRPADGGCESQAEETDLNGSHDEGLRDERVNLYRRDENKIKRVHSNYTCGWRRQEP